MVGGASLAFYALIGFEDSVNVAEETQEPSRAFPRALFGGLAVAGVIYLLVTMTASMVVSTDDAGRVRRSAARGGARGAARHPAQAVSRHRAARGRQRRADQHDHGLAAGLRDVAPGHRAARLRPRAARPAGRRTSRSCSPRCWHGADPRPATWRRWPTPPWSCCWACSSIVNITVLVLRRDEVDHEHFTAPTFVPVLGRAGRAVPDLRQVHRRRECSCARGCCWRSAPCSGRSTG